MQEGSETEGFSVESGYWDLMRQQEDGWLEQAAPECVGSGEPAPCNYWIFPAVGHGRTKSGLCLLSRAHLPFMISLFSLYEPTDSPQAVSPPSQMWRIPQGLVDQGLCQLQFGFFSPPINILECVENRKSHTKSWLVASGGKGVCCPV